MRAVCQQCGREFDTHRKGHRFCTECALKRKRAAGAAYASRRKDHGYPIGNGLDLSDANRAAFPPSDEVIRNAKEKPRGVSDIRWRIELRRRANAARFEAAPGAGDTHGSGGRELPPLRSKY